MRPTALLALCAIALPACGSEDPIDAVRSAVEEFGAATAKKDYQRLCDELLADELVSNVEEIGLPCEVALKQGLGEVRQPKIEIRKVAVNGKKALVSIRSTAANQDPSEDVLELIEEGGDWKVSALAKPQPQPPARTTP